MSRDDATQVKRGGRDQSLPVRTVNSRDLAACERAPTLLANSTPGANGAVQVWSPSLLRLRCGIAAAAIFGFCHTWFMVIQLIREKFPDAGNLWIMVGWILVIFFLSGSLCRPCYITMDDAGIGMATANGTQALRWSQVRELRWDGAGLVLRGVETTMIELTGYSGAARKELMDAIVTGAGLLPHPQKKQVFLSTAELALAPGEVGPFYGD